MAEQGLDIDAAPELITIKSNKDGKTLQVERKYALLSTLIKTSLELDTNAREIELSVDGPILELVCEYLNEHKGVDPPELDKPVKSKIMSQVCAKYPWDGQFMDRIALKRADLYSLMLAANYMDIKPLLHLTCAKMATYIKGRPLTELKSVLDPKIVETAESAAATATAAAVVPVPAPQPEEKS